MARATPFLGNEGPGAALLAIGDINLVHVGSDVRFALLGGRFVGEATLLRFYVLHCIAGHVGADTAAVVLSEAPYLREEITLLFDVGNNAEIVLGNRHRMLAASWRWSCCVKFSWLCQTIECF